MTKEELIQEAEEYTKNLLKKLGIKEDMLLENQPKYLRQENLNFVALDVENVTDAYLASAEPREKQIQALGERCLQLQKDKGELIDKVRELEAQIEEMKLCQNCKSESIDYTEYPCRNCTRCLGDIKREGNTDNWEIKEK